MTLDATSSVGQGSAKEKEQQQQARTHTKRTATSSSEVLPAPQGQLEYLYELSPGIDLIEDPMPRYTRSPIVYPPPSSDTTNANNSGISGSKQKRATSTSNGAGPAQATVPFVLGLTCSSYVSNATCVNVQRGLNQAMARLAQILHVSRTIYINATVNSYCYTGADAANCKARRSTLASTYPTRQFSWTAGEALGLGVDANYKYPSSLVKQYAPNDPVIVGDPYASDITITINADVNWWFPTAEDAVGSQFSAAFQPIASGTSLTSVYDFEQVALHEIHHGLGFISSWYTNTDYGKTIMLPAWGTDLPNIFNKFIADNVNGVWMREYETSISSYLAQSRANASVSFAGTVGFQHAQYVYTSLVTRPNTLLFWFPKSFTGSSLLPHSLAQQRQNLSTLLSSPFGTTYALHHLPAYAVLYTPETYSPGSTLSHVDADTYRGTSNFLMRPFAAAGAGMDAFAPVSKTYGPEGLLTMGILSALGYTTALSLSLEQQQQ